MAPPCLQRERRRGGRCKAAAAGTGGAKNLKILLDKPDRMRYYISCVVSVAWRLGSIAQLGEHLPYKQRVTGSSPVVPTIHVAR